MQQLAIVAAVATTSLASTGQMTTLGGTGVGSSCEYANGQNGGRKSPAATSPHFVSDRYCGVNAKLLKGGAGCGECYKVCKGSRCEVVQVVDTADVDFACSNKVMKSITGATTGIFPVTYNKVACEVASANGVATVLDGNNAYFVKAIFSDLPHAVSSAKLMIGKHKSFSMDRVAGATFKANTDGPSKFTISFELTLSDGSISKLDGCFKGWPVATNSFCAPAAHSGTVVNEPEAGASLSTNDTIGTTSGCTRPGSIPPTCQKCLESAQCSSGFCCPFMKKCVTSSSQRCSYPIGNCRPTCQTASCTTCHPSDGTSYSNWAPATCKMVETEVLV